LKACKGTFSTGSDLYGKEIQVAIPVKERFQQLVTRLTGSTQLRCNTCKGTFSTKDK